VVAWGNSQLATEYPEAVRAPFRVAQSQFKFSTKGNGPLCQRNVDAIAARVRYGLGAMLAPDGAEAHDTVLCHWCTHTHSLQLASGAHDDFLAALSNLADADFQFEHWVQSLVAAVAGFEARTHDCDTHGASKRGCTA